MTSQYNLLLFICKSVDEEGRGVRNLKKIDDGPLLIFGRGSNAGLFVYFFLQLLQLSQKEKMTEFACS